MIRNRTTPEGHQLGAKLAEWCETAEPVARLIEPALPTRCSSCAFRAGSHLASGSPETQMNALKCVMERTEFQCHQHDRVGEPCAGWLTMMLATDEDAPQQAPWPFVQGSDKR